MFSKRNKYKISIFGLGSDEIIVDYIGWTELSKMNLSEKILDHNAKRIDWDAFSRYGKSEYILEKYIEKMDMESHLLFNKNRTTNINLMVPIRSCHAYNNFQI